jgi:hypothetical protein
MIVVWTRLMMSFRLLVDTGLVVGF